MPLKRHPSLQPYSREHHHELLLVWKIREGVRKNIEVIRIADYCLYYYLNFLLAHFEDEEKNILSRLPQDNEDVICILREHVLMKNMIRQISAHASNSYHLLLAFADLLEKHTRFEERTFFKTLQESLPEDVLNSIEADEAEMNFTEAWRDEFWEQELPGTTLLT